MAENGNSDGANPAIAAKHAEIEAAVEALEKTQGEIGATCDRLAALRQYEGTLQAQITQLKAEHRAMITTNTNKIAVTLKEAVQTDEEKMRELQNQLSVLEAARESKLQELSTVEKAGHNIDTAVAAGANQQRINAEVARYDLLAPTVQTGLSSDPLAQTPYVGTRPNIFTKRPSEGLAPSIDQIGMRATASPYVKPEDYKVDGQRPTTPGKSAKFADWKTPSRNSTRVAQPPGGYSHMNSIFG